MQDLRVTLLQADLHWEASAANLAMFEEMIWDAEKKSDLIVLPEMFSTGFTMDPKPVAEPHNFTTFKWMKQMANQQKAMIIGSFVIRDGDNYFNRLYAVGPDNVHYSYDKRHLFRMAGEDEAYSEGKERLIFEWKGWKICPMVCYDLRFPVWARNQSKPGQDVSYDVLVYVANWPKPRITAWDTLLKARSIENQSYTIGVNRVGLDANNYEYIGHSAVYDYAGECLTFNEGEVSILQTSLKHKEMQQFRTKLPFLKDADDFDINI